MILQALGHPGNLATMDWVQWYNEDRIHSYSGDIPSESTRKSIIEHWNPVN